MANYLETISGRKIDFFNPDPDQIDLDDIVHALMQVPRFAGHVRKFYSVMTHSVNVGRLCGSRQRYQGLLHDATEAYLMDMPTPFKVVMPDYKAAEARIWNAICIKLDINPVISDEVHAADRVALMTERDFLKPIHGDWGPELEGVIRAPEDMFAWQNYSKVAMIDHILNARDMYIK